MLAKTEIKLENIVLNFKNKTIFNKLTYCFENGIYLLQGISGVGKTTLLNIIAGFVTEYDGCIHISNCNSIGYMFQDDMLFSNLTAKENLYIKFCAVKERKQDFEKILEILLEKFQINFLLDEKVKYLSGGEKQKLQLAMLAMDNPDIILLDEPFSKLDLDSRQDIIQCIMKEWKNKLVIIVSHDMIEMNDDLKHLILKEGKVYEK